MRQSQADRNYANCEETVASTLLDATRQLLYLRTGEDKYKTVTAYIADINATLTAEEGELKLTTMSDKIINGWILFREYGATTLNGDTIDKELFDSTKWPVDHQSKRAEVRTLEFVLLDDFGTGVLAKLRAERKSVKTLTGKGKKKTAAEPAETETKTDDLNREIAALKGKIVARDEQIAERDEQIRQLQGALNNRTALAGVSAVGLMSTFM